MRWSQQSRDDSRRRGRRPPGAISRRNISRKLDTGLLPPRTRRQGRTRPEGRDHELRGLGLQGGGGLRRSEQRTWTSPRIARSHSVSLRKAERARVVVGHGITGAEEVPTSLRILTGESRIGEIASNVHRQSEGRTRATGVQNRRMTPVEPRAALVMGRALESPWTHERSGKLPYLND
jgi:hypothetical protein